MPIFNIWKFWAFNRVDNVHELKNRLISLKYISEKSRFFKRIENSTEDDEKYWKLRLKFAREDVFIDDGKNSTITLIGLFFVTGGIIGFCREYMKLKKKRTAIGSK